MHRPLKGPCTPPRLTHVSNRAPSLRGPSDSNHWNRGGFAHWPRCRPAAGGTGAGSGRARRALQENRPAGVGSRRPDAQCPNASGRERIPPATPRGSFPAGFPSTAATSLTAKPGRPAAMVATGILFSRILGLIRNRVFAHYFGTSDAADAFNAAFRIPNFLQNIFGEGALSASFIPVYARLLAQEDKKEATRVASAVLSVLALVTSIVVLTGVLTTPYLISLIAPGFTGEKRE